MPPKMPPLSDHDLFRMRLEAMIDGRHELVRLAKLTHVARMELANAVRGRYAAAANKDKRRIVNRT